MSFTFDPEVAAALAPQAEAMADATPSAVGDVAWRPRWRSSYAAR
jgi:hypothetical protein